MPRAVAEEWAQRDTEVFSVARSFYRGQDIHRYSVSEPEDVLLFVNDERDFERSRTVRQHLTANRSRLECRDEVRNGSTSWFALRSCDYAGIFTSQLVAWPDTAKEPRFCLLPAGTVIGNTAFCILGDYAWLLPLLNSQTGWKIVSVICQSRDERAGQMRYRLLPQFIAQFPLPQIPPALRESLALIATGKEEHGDETERAIVELYRPLGLT